MPSLPDVIVDLLRAEGVRAIFGVPGGAGNLDLIEAARKIDLPFVLMTTETGAAIAAIAQAEITNAPGACLTTLGPGAASVTNGVACAYLERAPIVVFTDAMAAGASGFQHQRIDQPALFRPITRYSGSLAADPGQMLSDLASALKSRTPGPIHIDCPGDLAALTPPPVGQERAPMRDPRRPMDADQGARLAGLIKGVRKPLLIAGLGARDPETTRAVRALCEGSGVPAMVTYKAKGVVPDEHPWFAGVFTNAAIERPILDEADAVIAVGLDPVEFLPRPWSAPEHVVYCGEAPPDGFAQLPVTAGPLPSAAALHAIGQGLQTVGWDRDRIRKHVDSARAAVNVRATDLTAQQVVLTASKQLARESRVTVDAGAHMFAATMLWPVSEPNQMLISNGLSTMGFALPAAIGAALLDRSRLTVALTGDGGLLMCVGELAAAARERLRVMVIVFNDASLSLIEIKQQARKLPAAGVALGHIDWPKMVRGFGIPAWTASSVFELETAVESAARVEGPTVIEARIDRSNYAETLKVIRG